MAKKEMKLLFSLTKKDFLVQTFCTGGKGGQHRNAKQNGVRIIHIASGARAEHRDGRDQAKNKEAAFMKLAKNDAFLKWHKAEVARRLRKISDDVEIYQGISVEMEDSITESVERQMRPENLKIEEF